MGNQRPKLITVMKAPDNLAIGCAVDGRLLPVPVTLIGFSNDETTAYISVDHPRTRIWFTTDKLHGGPIVWEKGDEHSHSDTRGACLCGWKECNCIGLYDTTSEVSVENMTGRSLKRSNWLDNLAQRKKKRQEYSKMYQARRKEQVSA